MRPGDIGGGGDRDSPLESLEKEVQEIKKAFEDEQAEVTYLRESLKELFMRNNCEEYLHRLERRIQVIENKDVETVQWRIPEIERVRSRHSKGQHIASPEFSACGLDGFVFHFYPRGDDFADEGYCSLYLHVPSDTTVERVLFVGRAKHGPAEADSIKHCGVSEICVLSNEIDKDTGSLVVGVDGLRVVSSPHVVEVRTKLQLFSDR